MASSNFKRALVTAASFAALAVVPAVSAQSGSEAPAVPLHVSGRVVRPNAKTTVPVPDIMVTLHRVGSDAAGPVDSVRASGTGTYAFTFRPRGVADAVYFAAASYGGVAYFTVPFKAENLPSAEDAEITVFDTTSGPVPIDVRGHHMIVGRPNADGVRNVTEVFELSNDSVVTRVAIGDAPSGAVWSVALPKGARQPAVTEGDIPRGAVTFVDGRANVFAPMGPGIKQLVVTYEVPDEEFPLKTTAQSGTGVLEVLLEEPKATVNGFAFKDAGMASVGPRAFHRYLASDVPAQTTLTVDVPSAGQALTAWYMAALTLIIGGSMIGALVYALKRR